MLYIEELIESSQQPYTVTLMFSDEEAEEQRQAEQHLVGRRLLQAERLITGDKYVFIRNAYLQTREFKVKDGQVVDDF